MMWHAAAALHAIGPRIGQTKTDVSELMATDS